jgi:hypothetical protein
MAKEPEADQPSANDNVRRVYALPAEMVERITAFQREKGLPSEVEAVRRLIDEALKSRDTLETIINRMLAKLAQTRIASEAAKDVLVGHPLVTGVSFEASRVHFWLKDKTGAIVSERGNVDLLGMQGDDAWSFHDDANKFAGGGINMVPF